MDNVIVDGDTQISLRTLPQGIKESHFWSFYTDKLFFSQTLKTAYQLIAVPHRISLAKHSFKNSGLIPL